MSVTQNTANFPGPNAPIDQNGEVVLSQPWFQFFLALLARTGGNGTPSGDFSSLLAAVQAVQSQADFQSVVMQDQAAQEALRRIVELAAEMIQTTDLRRLTGLLNELEMRLLDVSLDLRTILARLDEYDARFLDQSGASSVPPVEQWTSASFLNSWVDFGAPYSPTGYFKDPFGIVRIRGVIKSGTAPNPAFILPTAYRPANQHIFPVITNGTLGRVDIYTTGEVYLVSASNVYVSLDNISFRAA